MTFNAQHRSTNIMSNIPLLTLSKVFFKRGGKFLFKDLDLVIQRGDCIALVGRNGSGKSSLLKLLAGLIEPDSGCRMFSPKISLGYMEQDPPMEGFTTLGDYANSELKFGETYRLERAAEGLKFDLNVDVSVASGGERRRAALVKLLASVPDLMLLDEPTNHLDIQAITWLEKELRQKKASYVIVSHDRKFLKSMTNNTIWIDRDQVRRNQQGFECFEVWRDRIWEQEDTQLKKIDQQIKSETRWSIEGVTARRKRNQGRLRDLYKLKAERAAITRRPDAVALQLPNIPKSGRNVIDAIEVAKSYEKQIIIESFSIKIRRGDRVAFVGPNGVGKTTLLNLLIGREAPDHGEVKHGTNLFVEVFDQARDQLYAKKSLWENLTDDSKIGILGKNDQILVRGKPKHVQSYLKEFLFEDTQIRSPVYSLSGGEKARLLLAKLMARESNLLVLDEPTNDLDIETLDLLQELLDDYKGTVLLVSHDRDFIDRVATTTVAMEQKGKSVIYAGGWSDYQNQKKLATKTTKQFEPKTKKSKNPLSEKSKNKTGLSFTEKHRLKSLLLEIEKFETEIEKLEQYLSSPDLFINEPIKFKKATEALVERQMTLSRIEEEWLMLAEKEIEKKIYTEF